MSGTFWGFKTGKDAAGLGKGQTPYNVWDSPPHRPLPHSREPPRPSGPGAEGERCRPGSPPRWLTRSSFPSDRSGGPRGVEVACSEPHSSSLSKFVNLEADPETSPVSVWPGNVTYERRYASATQGATLQASPEERGSSPWVAPSGEEKEV